MRELRAEQAISNAKKLVLPAPSLKKYDVTFEGYPMRSVALAGSLMIGTSQVLCGKEVRDGCVASI